MKRVVAALTLLAFVGTAVAAPRTVLVLPVDGDADPAVRTKLTTSIQKLARVIDGQVKLGDTTLAEAAVAVGCDPATPACAETLRTTLGVDELVYATATKQGDKTTIVVRRKVKDRAPKQLSTTIPTKELSTRAEPAMLPVFTGAIEDIAEPVPDPVPDPVPNPEPVPEPVPAPVTPPKPKTRRDLSFGIAATAGGSAMLLAGLALWSSKSGLQDDIDRHPRNTVSDFQQIKELEDRANGRAWFGNVFVVAGLALAGCGVYLLWRDRREQRRVTLTPAPVKGGAAVILTIGAGR